MSPIVWDDDEQLIVGIPEGSPQETIEHIEEYLEELIEESVIVSEPESEDCPEWVNPEMCPDYLDFIEPEPEPEPDETLEFYSQFSLYELYYIKNSNEITEDFLNEILEYKGFNVEWAEIEWMNIDIRSQFNEYKGIEIDEELSKYHNLDLFEAVILSSEDILNSKIAPIKFIQSLKQSYDGYTIEQVADKVKWLIWNDVEAIYICIKLGIWDYGIYSELTGYTKPEYDPVKDFGRMIGDILRSIGQFGGDVVSGILGGNWQTNLAIVLVVAGVVGVGGLASYHYAKSYITSKASKRALK